MNTKKSKSKQPTLDELVFGALSQLQALQYDDRSIRLYQATWNRLIKFAKQNNFENKLSKNLIIEFLKHHDINLKKLKNIKSGWRKCAECSLKLLWQYSQYGYFERIHTLINKLTIPSAMTKILSEYVLYCKENLFICESSYNKRIREIGLFMDYATKQNIKSFNEIQPRHLSEYISMLWRYSSRTVSRIVSDIRQFLKYLFLRDLITKDISQALPVVHTPLHSKIPSVWDKKLLVKLLSTVDRASPRGKRDYAILLLACRLGLRVKDIRNLTLDQINWESETISFVQSKTQRHLVLPLINEVGNALIDYIKLVRPKTHYRQVFLRLKLPFIPFGKNDDMSRIVRYWRELAGIKFKSKQHHGMHSLRHSLATYLLEEETPFFVISNILGHKSTASTMIYAKSSVEMLRQVALSLQEVDHVY